MRLEILDQCILKKLLIVYENNFFLFVLFCVYHRYGFQWRHFGAKYEDCNSDYRFANNDYISK